MLACPSVMLEAPVLEVFVVFHAKARLSCVHAQEVHEALHHDLETMTLAPTIVHPQHSVHIVEHHTGQGKVACLSSVLPQTAGFFGAEHETEAPVSGVTQFQS